METEFGMAQRLNPYANLGNDDPDIQHTPASHPFMLDGYGWRCMVEGADTPALGLDEASSQSQSRERECRTKQKSTCKLIRSADGLCCCCAAHYANIEALTKTHLNHWDPILWSP